MISPRFQRHQGRKTLLVGLLLHCLLANGILARCAARENDARTSSNGNGGNGYLSRSLIPGDYFVVRVNVTPDGSVPVGASKTMLLQAQSTLNATLLDVVKSITTKIAPVAGASRTDLLVANGGDASWTGNNLYNTTGDNQKVSQTPQSGQTVAYFVMLQNDGGSSTRFVLNGLASTPITTPRLLQLVQVLAVERVMHFFHYFYALFVDKSGKTYRFPRSATGLFQGLNLHSVANPHSYHDF